MPSNADKVILTFPPRPLSQWEKALLAAWLAATQRRGLDVHRAFVSERRGDDPKIRLVPDALCSIGGEEFFGNLPSDRQLVRDER
jgi:hypothetical protein